MGMDGCGLGSRVWSLCTLQRQDDCETCALADSAGDVNAALVIFHDAAGQRQSEAGAVALGGVEGTENVGEVIRVDTASVISHFDDGCRTLGSQRDGDLSVRVDRLQSIQQ